MAKPLIFVGSSKENLPIARALNLVLRKHDLRSSLWDSAGAFIYNRSNIENLWRQASSFDFACLILEANDRTATRSVQRKTPRDNMIFEFGLFLGALGRDRVFVVYDRRRPPSLPTDVAGVTFCHYDLGDELQPSHAVLEAALYPVATMIGHEVDTLGARAEASSPKQFPEEDKTFVVAPLDKHNARWRNLTEELIKTPPGEEVRFTSITGRNFLLPAPIESLGISERLGPEALLRGVRLRGLVLDPYAEEARLRSAIESPGATNYEERLLIEDALVVRSLPRHLQKNGISVEILDRLKLRYAPGSLPFGLWLFQDVAFLEPFHFGKRPNLEHLCGFAQMRIPKDTEEYSLLELHFEALWEQATDIEWRR